MKYFTADMWGGVNVSDDRTSLAADRKWDRNLANYRRQLAVVAPKLGKAGSFFLKHSMHDANVLSLNIHDYPLRNLGPRRIGSHTWVRVYLLAWERVALIYELIYDDIQSIKIETRNDLFSLESSRFGDWGYDELLPKGRSAFQHNILFSSGTELTIVFKKFRFKRLKRSDQAVERIVNPLCGFTTS
jgi:hypothetical protein